MDQIHQVVGFREDCCLFFDLQMFAFPLLDNLLTTLVEHKIIEDTCLTCMVLENLDDFNALL